jgi:hypothetical protein
MATENPFSEPLRFKFTNKIKAITPITNHVIVHNMNFGARQLSSGVLLLSDDAKSHGIRPRWAQVYAIGPEQRDVSVGQWILIEHGRWTRGVYVEIDGTEIVLRRVDADAIMLVSDEEPTYDDVISTAVHAEQRSRN